MFQVYHQHECICKNGCHECNFEFILEKENKDNDDLMGVYSSDFVTVFNPKHNFNVVSYIQSLNKVFLFANWQEDKK